MAEKPYLNGVKAIAAYINVSIKTLNRMRKRVSLRIIKTGHCKKSRVMTKIEWVDEWLEKLSKFQDN